MNKVLFFKINCLLNAVVSNIIINFAAKSDKNIIEMYRTKTCGELRLADAGQVV